MNIECDGAFMLLIVMLLLLHYTHLAAACDFVYYKMHLMSRIQCSRFHKQIK